MCAFPRYQVVAAIAVSICVSACGGGDGSPSVSTSRDVQVVSSPPTTATPPPPLPVPSDIPVIIQAGDSIGAGDSAGGYEAIYHMASSVTLTIANISVSGRSLTDGYQRASSEIYPYRASYAPSILLIEQGTNDLGNDVSADQLYNTVLVPFVNAAKKAGFYVIVDTILPRSDPKWNQAKERSRILYNTRIRENTALADAVNDFAADVDIGDSAGSMSAYYADGLHPSVLGQQRLSVLDLAAIRPFLTVTPRPPT